MKISEDNNQTRREFLKLSTVFLGGVALYSVFSPLTVFADVAEKKEELKMYYGFYYDVDKCIGCGSCAQACKEENDVPREPFFYRTWIEQYTIKNNDEIIVESPNGGIDGFKQAAADDEIFKAFFVPKTCNHCSKSPCDQVCPVGATFKTVDGVVLVDEKYCIGCGYCIQACPYGCRYLHPIKKVADKCTLCYHRLAKGLKPACVEVCPTGARKHGNLNDKAGPMNKFLKEHACRVLKPHLNTGSKLFYNKLNEEVR